MKNSLYVNYTKKTAKKSNLFSDCLWAFFVGGGICLIGEGILYTFTSFFRFSEDFSKKWVSIILIMLAALLTGLGWFDKLAKKAGAGTLVPITGFSNAMVSPSIDNKAEGWVLGVGANMFKIAGPVIAYGTVASVVYGVIYWITTLF